ncbi:DUF7848 domain-containing protein [Actinacidiphila soli]|uniref:DUF7848 domain-containing protein n=1 Tax=Actinacidiphila soli TaxID=2487275 RepID=UPI0013E36196|nr:hypothetical protein [Actinacidiphila soli]
MNPSAIIKAAEWTLSVEAADGAPSGIFQVQCIACAEMSPAVDDDRLAVELWAMKHTGANTAHRQFKLATESFWRVDPAPSNPLCEGGRRAL